MKDSNGNLDPDFELVAKYVDAVADLELALRRDLKAGTTISSNTVARLSSLISASQRIGFFLDAIEAQRVKLN